jgi:hypothetical protein
MMAKTNIPVFHPMIWDKILHAHVPTYLLDGYSKFPCLSFREGGANLFPFFIPKGTEYKRIRNKYYSTTLKRLLNLKK